jgi:hypothetical protein
MRTCRAFEEEGDEVGVGGEDKPSVCVHVPKLLRRFDSVVKEVIEVLDMLESQETAYTRLIMLAAVSANPTSRWHELMTCFSCQRRCDNPRTTFSTSSGPHPRAIEAKTVSITDMTRDKGRKEQNWKVSSFN